MSESNWLAYNDLVYYDEKIKSYINKKADSIIQNTYSKADIDNKLSILTEFSDDIAKLQAIVAAQKVALESLKEHLDEDEADILALQAEDKAINNKVGRLITEVEVLKEASKDYATTEYVKDQIREAQLEAGDIDLSDYAKKSQVDELSNTVGMLHTEIDSVQSSLEQYVTETELSARNYATLDKLESYATKDYVTEAISNIPAVDLSNLATKESVEAVQNVAGQNSVKLFAIESELFDIDKKLETIPTKLSELDNDAGFISAIPSEYITESELESKGYLTEHQSLENYATNESVRESIESVEQKIPSLDGYATEQYVLDHVNTTIEKEVETQVTEVVEKQVTEVVQTQVKDEVAEQLAKNEKINYGTFGEI